MNATDVDLVNDPEPFLVPVLMLIAMCVAAALFVFTGIQEAYDPWHHVIVRLDIIVRYWPILICSAICYSIYKTVEFIALHTCCKPQQPVIIARPLATYDKMA